MLGFCVTGRAKNPLGFVRWVVYIKACGRYTLYLAMHYKLVPRAGGKPKQLPKTKDKPSDGYSLSFGDGNRSENNNTTLEHGRKT
jgi:hypothetical protein